MNNTIDTCGCCAGIQQVTPTAIANRPGLSTLAYRAGIHATFFETMLARLSNMSIPLGELATILDDPSQANDPRLPLQGLTTRALDDPSIAMLDAWAVVADVLTFYQERIANEGYLRTATERRSILELARLIGYKLRPGVAASVFLAYTLEDGQRTTIPHGSSVRSLPKPLQTMQPFETSFAIEARAEWNAIKPKMSAPQYISQILDPEQISTQSLYSNTHDGAIYLQGTNTNLKPGDPLLFVFNEQDNGQVFGHTQQIDPHQAEKYARAVFSPYFTPYTFFRSLEDLLALYQKIDVFGLPTSNQFVQTIVSFMKSIVSFLQDSESSGLKSFVDTYRKSQLDSLLAGLCMIYNCIVPPSGSQPSVQILEDGPWATLLSFQSRQGSADELCTMAKASGAPLPRLAAWVGGIINDVKAILNTVPELRDSLRYVCPAVVITSPTALVSQLAKAPSEQPANSIRLQRNVTDVFSRKSDIALNMLQTLNQAVAPNLYSALSNATVTAPPLLQDVYAFRVKAAPFGSTAPLKPVYDDQGRFQNRYEEWPLLSPFPFVLQIPDFKLVTNQLRITVLLQQGSQPFGLSRLAILDIPQPSHEDTTTIIQTVSFSDIVPSAPDITIKITAHKKGNTTVLSSAEIVNIISTIEITIDKDYIITLTPQPQSDASHIITSWDVSVAGKVQNIHIGETCILETNTTIRYDFAKLLSIFYTAPRMQSALDLHVLDLDAPYDKIVSDSWIVVEYANTTPLVTKVQQVQSLTRADYSMSSKVTRLMLEKRWLTGKEQYLSELRGITIYAQSEKLPLAEEPLTDDIQGKEIELDNLYDGLQSGRWVVVSGERTDIANTSGVRTSELVLLESVTQKVRMIKRVPPASPGSTPPDPLNLPGDKLHTFLQFAIPLSYTYKRDTVTIGANVVKATHGETKNEVLGSGDGSAGIQQFTLKQSPVTYVAAPTGTGAQSTLQVFVNDIEWHEVDNLDKQGPKDRVFVTQTDDQDKTTVIFGNGIHGAHLPTGAENVRATYRIRLGQDGNVDAEQINILATRPLGVKGVINPLQATGGADHESRDAARRVAPLAVQALDRVVSVQDYADFARTFAGIAKASVALLSTSSNRQQVVHLTIAGQDNIPIDPNSDLYRNLFLALRTLGNPSEPLRIDVCEVKLLIISARIRLLPDYQLESVVVNVRSALLNAFGFEQRDLGQPVYQSEVLSVIQFVPGVAFVDLDILDAVAQADLLNALDSIHQEELQEAASGTTPNETEDLITLLKLQVQPVVAAQLARVDNQTGTFTPAQLVFLTPNIADTLIINE